MDQATPPSPAGLLHGQQATPAQHLLEVRDLYVEFRTYQGRVKAVNGLSYTLDPGETLAILGESGSGKSVSAQAVVGILDSPPAVVPRGEVLFRGEDLLRASKQRLRAVRGEEIAMVFQDALTSLNPVFTVGFQIRETLRKHRGLSRSAARKQTIELMDRVRIPNAAGRFDDYPYQFSGGMRQRVMIAMAIALDPAVLIADEPTTALDVTVQAQIMELLKDLQRDTGMGLILITHDLGVVAEVAERLCVMYTGRAMETGPIRDVYRRPAHPYTLGLMQSIPRTDVKGTRLQPIMGQPPDLARIPPGCEFNPRCAFARDLCVAERPPLFEVAAGRGSACHFFEEVLDAGQ